jgi:periplasmic divalent cation tolerance protein
MIGADSAESRARPAHGVNRPGPLSLSPLNPSPGTQVSENECLVVLCTCPEGAPAARLAEALVDEGLAACVNRLPGVLSNFRWDGRVQQETETLLLIKTTRARLQALTARVRDLHPYELPEVVAVPVVGGLAEYLDWVRASATGASNP